MNVDIISKTTAFQGYFKVIQYQLRHQRFDGSWSAVLGREMFHRGHAVAVLPYDPVLDQVLLIEQFRIGAYAYGDDPWMLEIVAGIIEAGETVTDVAKRESIEETGCAVEKLVPIHRYFASSGAVSEHFDVFCSKIDSAKAGGIFGLAEENEDIKVHVMSVAEALDKLNQGRIKSGMTIIALQWLALNHDKIRQPEYWTSA